MEDKFSIGEVAQLNDVSIKALRHYDEIGLLKPKYTDPTNGYRYYSYDQFQFLDKIKRYKNAGLSLKDMKEVFQSKELSKLEKFLRTQQQSLEEEAHLLAEKRKCVDWLSDFLEYSKTLETTNDVYTMHYPERYALYAECMDEEPVYEMDMRLRLVSTLPMYKNLKVLNPYGYVLDFDRLMKNTFKPKKSVVAISSKPENLDGNILVLPEGDYLCARGKILSDKFEMTFLIDYCKKNNFTTDFVIAFEYLKSLNNPSTSPYEIQMLIKNRLTD